MTQKATSVLLIIASLFLTGCSITYKSAGKFSDSSDKFIGTVEHNIWSGGGAISLDSVITDLKCSGKAIYTGSLMTATCSGLGGTISMVCTDDRTLEGTWTTTSCTTGFGSGKDSKGHDFEFVFGLTESEAKEYVK